MGTHSVVFVLEEFVIVELIFIDQQVKSAEFDHVLS